MIVTVVAIHFPPRTPVNDSRVVVFPFRYVLGAMQSDDDMIRAVSSGPPVPELKPPEIIADLEEFVHQLN